MDNELDVRLGRLEAASVKLARLRGLEVFSVWRPLPINGLAEKSSALQDLIGGIG